MPSLFGYLEKSIISHLHYIQAEKGLSEGKFSTLALLRKWLATMESQQLLDDHDWLSTSLYLLPGIARGRQWREIFNKNDTKVNNYTPGDDLNTDLPIFSLHCRDGGYVKLC